MIPINNSDTAWLIVADYNQDNNLPYEDLKEDILNPNIDNWHYEYKPYGVGGGIGGNIRVGGVVGIGGNIGGYGGCVGSIGDCKLVGGNKHDPYQ